MLGSGCHRHGGTLYRRADADGGIGAPRSDTRTSWAGLAALGPPIIRTAGIKVELDGVENIENLPSFVLVANHQSMFDIMALLAYFPRPVRFVAKKELLKIPVFGYALKNGGHIVIDRQSGGQEVRKAVDIAKSGLCIVFFAEGHRFSDNQIHRFNPGAAWLALLTGLSCVPMAISGSAAFMPRGARTVVPGKTMRISSGYANSHRRLAGQRPQQTNPPVGAVGARPVHPAWPSSVVQPT